MSALLMEADLSLARARSESVKEPIPAERIAAVPEPLGIEGELAELMGCGALIFLLRA
jgi:hypothetical protein